MRLLDISGQAPSSRQLVKQRLGLFQIERVEAFGEPVVDRSQEFPSLLHLALRARRSRATPPAVPRIWPVACAQPRARSQNMLRLSRHRARAAAKKVFIEIFNPVIVGWKWLRIHTNRDNVVCVRAFAGLWSAALVALPQNKPLNLPAGSLGQFGNEGDLARESVCRKPCPHVLL